MSEFEVQSGKYVLVPSSSQFDPCQTSVTMKGLRQKRAPVLPSSSTSQWLHAPTEKKLETFGYNDSVNRRTSSPSLNDEAIAISPTRDLLSFASVGCVSTNAAST